MSTTFLKLNGNFSEGFTAIGPFDSFDDAAAPDPTETELIPPGSLILDLDPADGPGATNPNEPPERFIALSGNLIDGVQALGPFHTREAAWAAAQTKYDQDSWE